MKPQYRIRNWSEYNAGMNYPAASGRGIRIKKEQVAHLGATGDTHCLDS
ncbi:MAG: hypothetical protein IGR76_17965 [Synechococcales cyanobacterium T60_A2020_003]|nr:hypothetical protein [Synechococcales cyanobacterium T60_A2020_003]